MSSTTTDSRQQQRQTPEAGKSTNTKVDIHVRTNSVRRALRKKHAETDSAEPDTQQSDDEIAVRRSDSNAAEHAPTSSTTSSKKRIASSPAQDGPSKRGRHDAQELEPTQVQCQEKLSSPGVRNGSHQGSQAGSQRLIREISSATNTIPDQVLRTTLPRHNTQSVETISDVLRDRRSPPSRPGSDVILAPLNASPTGNSTHERENGSTDGTGAVSTNSYTQPQSVPDHLVPNEGVSQLGEHAEPRITENDIKSLQPSNPLTDNAILFGLKLFRRDQKKTQICERCRKKKESGPRRACSDGKVQQIIMQLNYENHHWLFAVIDLVAKRWSARDPLKGAPHLERAREDVKTFLCNENIDEWTEVPSTESGPWQSNGHDCGPICIYYAIREMFDIDPQHVPIPEILRRAIHFGMPRMSGDETRAPFEPRNVLQWMPAENLRRSDQKGELHRAVESDKRVEEMMNLMDELHAEHSNLISMVERAMEETVLIGDIIRKAQQADVTAVAEIQAELDQLQEILKLLAGAAAESFMASAPWIGAQQDGISRVTGLQTRMWESQKDRDYRSKALEAVSQGLQHDLRAYEGMKASENHRWETLKVRILQRWD